MIACSPLIKIISIDLAWPESQIVVRRIRNALACAFMRRRSLTVLIVNLFLRRSL
jgi:hypothetical protein